MTRIATSMLLLGGLAGLAVAGAAGAGTVIGDVPEIVVRYSTDTLATDGGARSLYRQLERAAVQVCPMPSNTRIVNERVLKCREEALTAAVNKIHNQRLAALHAAANPKAG
jgi:UrcA family protein